MLEKIREVPLRPELTRKYTQLTSSRVQAFVEDIGALSVLIPMPPSAFKPRRDPKDEPFIDLAVAGNGDYLVTWNVHCPIENEGSRMSRFSRVIPPLVYADIPAAHDFLVNAFGFDSGGVEQTADGLAVHADVRAGDTTIWLHRVGAEHEMGSPAAEFVMGIALVVYVDDVDAHFKRARAAGATIDSEPMDQPYGQRDYGARDPEGHRWWFASPLK